MSSGLLRTVVFGGVTILAGAGAQADDWPAHKRDALRSGVSSEHLDLTLRRRWTHRPQRPARPEPGKELNRLDFDYAFQPVVADGLACFGSSADDTVRSLDAKTGKLVWRFTAEGSVRFAPAMGRGKAFAASDDGVLHALDAQSAQLAWTFFASPGRDRLVGNDRLIARYPCRSGALLIDNIV